MRAELQMERDSESKRSGLRFGRKEQVTEQQVAELWSARTNEGLGSELRALMKKVVKGSADDEEGSKAGELRGRIESMYMNASLDKLFAKSEPAGPTPRPAQILQSLQCEECREMTMESRIRRFDGRTLCIPCFEKVEQKV